MTTSGCGGSAGPWHRAGLVVRGGAPNIAKYPMDAPKRDRRFPGGHDRPLRSDRARYQVAVRGSSRHHQVTSASRCDQMAGLAQGLPAGVAAIGRAVRENLSHRLQDRRAGVAASRLRISTFTSTVCPPSRICAGRQKASTISEHSSNMPATSGGSLCWFSWTSWHRQGCTGSAPGTSSLGLIPAPARPAYTPLQFGSTFSGSPASAATT